MWFCRLAEKSIITTINNHGDAAEDGSDPIFVVGAPNMGTRGCGQETTVV
jgi:hypothetical protein